MENKEYDWIKVTGKKIDLYQKGYSNPVATLDYEYILKKAGWVKK